MVFWGLGRVWGSFGDRLGLGFGVLGRFWAQIASGLGTVLRSGMVLGCFGRRLGHEISACEGSSFQSATVPERATKHVQVTGPLETACVNKNADPKRAIKIAQVPGFWGLGMVLGADWG